LEATKFNTAVSAFMEFTNFAFQNKKEIGRDTIERFLILLAPHITEELWHQIGYKDSIHQQKWPKWDPELIKEEMITLVIQVNGRVRDKIEVETSISEEKAKELVISREKVIKWIKDKEIKKVVFVLGKLINIVV